MQQTHLFILISSDPPARSLRLSWTAVSFSHLLHSIPSFRSLFLYCSYSYRRSSFSLSLSLYLSLPHFIFHLSSYQTYIHTIQYSTVQIIQYRQKHHRPSPVTHPAAAAAAARLIRQFNHHPSIPHSANHRPSLPTRLQDDRRQGAKSRWNHNHQPSITHNNTSPSPPPRPGVTAVGFGSFAENLLIDWVGLDYSINLFYIDKI